MLKDRNTGHPGGIATVNANSAHAALYRIERLMQESVTGILPRLVAEAIDLVLFIAGRGSSRHIETVAEVIGLDALDANGDYAVTRLSLPQPQSLS